MHGWQNPPHQRPPLLSASGELAKIRGQRSARLWCGCGRACNGLPFKRREDGVMRAERRKRRKVLRGAKQPPESWVTFKLCSSLFIRFYLGACACPGWLSQRSRSGHLLCLTGRMNKYVLWRNLSSSVEARLYGYFYSEVTAEKKKKKKRLWCFYLANFLTSKAWNVLMIFCANWKSSLYIKHILCCCLTGLTPQHAGQNHF